MKTVTPGMRVTNKSKTKQVKGAPALSLECSGCNQTSDHPLYWMIVGKWLALAGIVIYGTKQYVYVCPNCGQINKVIAKEEAAALKAA